MTKRDTLANKLVFKTLSQSKSALTANEIITRLNDEGFPFYKTTVYRILKRLMMDNKIIEITAKNRINYYELKKAQAHSHFFCHQCDKIYCLKELPTPSSLNTLNNTALENQFNVQSQEYNLYGVCKLCSTK